MLLMSDDKIQIYFDRVIDGSTYRYDVRSSDPKRPPGYATMTFDPLCDCDSNTVMERLNFEGLDEGAIVAEVVKFYPNGDLTDDEVKPHTRQGVGTGLLSMMTKDAENYGAEAMNIFTHRVWMPSFLEKHGFELCKKGFRDYYQLL